MFRKRLDYPDLKRAVVAQRDRFRPHRILIEYQALGTQLIQDLKRVGVYQVMGIGSVSAWITFHLLSQAQSSCTKRKAWPQLE
jgi:phage terminase large subunit-like protein